MNRAGKRIVALLLALSMTLGLAACGKDKESDDTKQLSSTVYVPEYIDLDMGKNTNVYGGCTDGKNVYLLMAKYPDWEAGEEGDTQYTIQSIPLEGGEMAPLENFKAEAAPEGYQQSYTYYNSIRAGADGTLWVSAGVSAYSYDVPEDFDPENDDYWNYEIKESIDKEYQIQLDSTGSEITRVETTELQEKAGVEYLYSDGTVFDAEGDIFVSTEGKVIVLDSSMNVLFTVEDENLWGGDLVMLSDGRIAARTSVRDTLNETYTYQLSTIDKAKKDWGESVPLPTNAYDVYSGSGEYLFYYQIGQALYGYKAETAEEEEPGVWLLNWMDADLPVDQLNFFNFLEDGRLVVMAQAWGDGMEQNENLAILTPTDRSTLPEKTILTYATMYLSQNERNRIINYNKSSTTRRIEVRDYSEYRTEDDYQAGVKKLNAEILAGQIPDLINTSQLPIRQYGTKGILEDLWPFIENDTGIGGRDGLMERVFTAAEQDGKLYQVFGDFSIYTVAGATSVVGKRNSWTLADLQAALATMPEGCAILNAYATKSDMLQNIVGMNLDNYVNWSDGACNFDSSEFKALLEFCNTFPAEYKWEDHQDDDDDDYTRISEGRQMLRTSYIGDPKDLQVDRALFGDNVSYVGFPKEDGSVGSSFNTNSGIAMSAACKDKEGAWGFMREMLISRYAGKDKDALWNVYQFPTNKADFEWMWEKSMIPDGYETDADGNQVLDENGNPIEISNSSMSWGGGFSVEFYAATEEDRAMFMDLYNKVDSMNGRDESIYEIVTDVAGGYFAGDKTLDDAAAQIQSRVKLYVDESR